MGDAAPTPRCSDGFGKRTCPEAILGLVHRDRSAAGLRSELRRARMTMLTLHFTKTAVRRRNAHHCVKIAVVR